MITTDRTIIDECIDILRREPWLTATEVAARLGCVTSSVHVILNRHARGETARLKRVHGVYLYALYHERTKPPESLID